MNTEKHDILTEADVKRMVDSFYDLVNKDELLSLANSPEIGPRYFVLNASLEELFTPVINERSYFELTKDGSKLANKQLIMLDEHRRNSTIAEAIEKDNKVYFNYEVWKTDHSFTNKRISMINKLIAFLDR